MCAYNSVNGIPACASQFLNNTLRGAWKFDGYVTSDSGAVADIYTQHHYVATAPEAAAAAIKGGTDINSGGVYSSSLLQAVSQKLISIADVNLALYRTLKLRFQLGLFDPIDDQPYWHVSPDVVNTAESQATNLHMSQQSMVLLKNDKNTLPFPKGHKVAVIGPHGAATGALVGNYLGQICPSGDYSCVVSPFSAIQQANKGGSTVYAQGCTVSGNVVTGFAAAIAAAQAADYVVLIIGTDTSVENEAHDRVNITLPGVQDEFSRQIINLKKPTAVVLMNGGAVAIEWLHDNADAIVEAFYPGYQGGTAIADVIFGDYNPGGKMPYTIYKADYVSQVQMTSMDMTKAPGRTYRYFTGTPLWPFGWGLSYTQFKLDWHNTTKPLYTISNADETQVGAAYQVNVTNIGMVAGDEVVQAYFNPANDSRVIKQLFGFQRVHLNAGQSVTLTFPVAFTSFLIGDSSGNLVSHPGSYRLQFTNGVSQKLETQLLIDGKPKITENIAAHQQERPISHSIHVV